MKFKKFSFVFLLAMLVSCGKDPSSSKSGKKGYSGSESYSSIVKDGYQIVYNGCDTGKKEFTAPTRAEVKTQLCNALQDNSFNNWCAESLRKEYFETRCEDMTWNSYSNIE